jgi:hypothetical protein
MDSAIAVEMWRAELFKKKWLVAFLPRLFTCGALADVN